MASEKTATSPRSHKIARKFSKLRDEASKDFDRLIDPAPSAVPGLDSILGPVVSWGRYVQGAISTLDSVDKLPDSGLFSPPLRRSIIEHAMTLAAVSDDPEIYQVLLRKMRKSMKTVKTATEDAGLDMPAGISEVLALDIGDVGLAKDTLQHFANLCKSLGNMGALYYRDWLDETQLSHVGVPTSIAYLTRLPDGSASLLERSAYVRDPLKDAAGEADIMILILDKLSQILQGDPARAKVDDLNRRKDELTALVVTVT